MKQALIALIYLLVLAFCLRVLLAMTGVMDAYNAHLPLLPAPGYVWPVVLHIAYGGLLFLCVIATGIAALRLLGGVVKLNDADLSMAGYLAGLVACLLLSLISFAGITGQLVAGLAISASLVAFFRAHGLRAWPQTEQLAVIVVLATALGGFLALLWRPATAGFAGSLDLADLSVYMGWYHALKFSLFPLYNLGVEGDTLTSYFNQLPTLYAVALDFLPGFDVYLFLSASLAAFLVLSLGWLLRALADFRMRRGGGAFSASQTLAVCGLMVASTWYPSWILDSPPVAFLAPVTLSALYLVERAGNDPLRLMLVFAVVVVATAISKVVALAVLGAFAGMRLLQGLRRSARRAHLALLLAFAAAAAYYILKMLQAYGGAFLPEWAPGPESWHRFQVKGWGEFGKVLPVLLKDTGLVLIVIGTLKTRDIALSVAAALGVVCNFVFPFLFTPTPAALTALVAGYLIVVREVPASAIRLFLTGAALMLPYFAVREPGVSYMLVIWTLSVGPAAFIALQPAAARRPPPAPVGARQGHWLHIASAAAVLVFLLVAVANGDFRIGKRRHRIVPVSLHDIWLQARRLTPRDALLFTDQTGDNEDRLSGWNDYSLIAERQFYISSWNISSLRNAPAARRKRLAANHAVLSGALSPASLSLSRHYGSYYAVLARGGDIPPGFRLVTANDDYALFEIDPRVADAPPS